MFARVVYTVTIATVVCRVMFASLPEMYIELCFARSMFACIGLCLLELCIQLCLLESYTALCLLVCSRSRLSYVLLDLCMLDLCLLA